jgi:hypothetical protein
MAAGPLAGGGRKEPRDDSGAPGGDVEPERGEEHRPGIGYVDPGDVHR